jgi:endonuclease YncB( thermonuclease family)
VATLIVLLAPPPPATADDWLVYMGGGLEPIQGGWDQRQGRVIFKKVGGTLVSVPFSEVDLAASAFITWQLNGGTEPPPRGPVPEGSSEERREAAAACREARVLRLVDAETLEVATETGRETIHTACLDAPDTRHRFAEIGWYGRATLQAVQLEVREGARVCLAEHSPPQRDRDDHRVLFVQMSDGRDYAAEVIGAGLGLLRVGPCSRGVEYRQLEDAAIAARRGLWGPQGARAAFTAASNSIAIGAGGGGAPPPRRIGGG